MTALGRDRDPLAAIFGRIEPTPAGGGAVLHDDAAGQGGRMGGTRDARVLAIEIRVRGHVQGVGFRPAMWRLARELGLTGEVLNDDEGVLIRAGGEPGVLAAFLSRIQTDRPARSHVVAIETRSYTGPLAREFRIISTEPTARAPIAPDIAICEACAADVVDPFGRRYRYAFTTCAQCGPRLSVMTGVPCDRASTTLAGFPPCLPCAAEYGDPADRRFHAHTTGCHACGPSAHLVRYDGHAVGVDQFARLDGVAAVPGLLARGEIVAIKDIGGYHLACDATRPDAIARLRAAKRRERKPFALMARSLDVIRRYCRPDAAEARALTSPAAPIVILAVAGPERLPSEIAPGLGTLGFMLPATPLHRLILHTFDRPIVMTSGNLAEEPPAIDDVDAAHRLAGLCSYALVHDRPIANRVDDSVVRVADGRPRMVRRARGYAPAPIKLPPGFEPTPPLLAYGGDEDAVFCLISRGEAIMAQHQGELHNPATLDDYRRNLALYTLMYEHAPAAIALDLHPELQAGRLARSHAATDGVPTMEVQHHHAHLAACLVDNARPLDAPPVLGFVLDTAGLGSDGGLWGGELLLADYRRARRLATFKPVALLGDRAAHEPWRQLYAQLVAELGWPAFSEQFGGLAVHAQLTSKPRALLDAMRNSHVGAPFASSCGSLFDAVAAALGLCFEQQSYPGEARAVLEAAVDRRALDEAEELAYPFALPRLPESELPYLEPLPMWRALLGDLARGAPIGAIAARFHRGLARALAQMASKLARTGHHGPVFDTVALSGDSFQNRILLEQCARRLRAEGFTVLSHAQVPPHDGGLALGQAAVCAARLLESASHRLAAVAGSGQHPLIAVET